MAWEWVAPVATGASGIVGVIFTWYAGHQGRQHAEQVAKDAASQALAKEREARRATAYVDVLTVVTTSTDTLSAIASSLMDREEEKVKLTALRDEYVAISAKIGVFGTQSVRNYYATWAKHRKSLISSHIVLREALEEDPEGAHTELWDKREAARHELKNAVTPLRHEMNRELAS